MKSRTLIAALAILACSAAVPAAAKGPNARPAPCAGQQLVVDLLPLDAEEAATLAWMREEEKMARDVYQVLYQAWNMPAFSRIAVSEQRHFDAIGSKLALYGQADPALAEPGQFSNPDLQALYEQHVDLGLASYVDALTAGAGIEDMDIADLLAAVETTDNPDLKMTYGNLLAGSKNHLRIFVGLLRSLGADYTPQYIDPVLFDAIMGD